MHHHTQKARQAVDGPNDGWNATGDDFVPCIALYDLLRSYAMPRKWEKLKKRGGTRGQNRGRVVILRRFKPKMAIAVGGHQRNQRG
jgi:hypothetical protein